MKKIFALAVCVFLCFSLAACGGNSSDPQQPQNTTEKEIPAAPDLSGEWKSDESDDGTCMGAYIDGESIEVYWVIPSEDMVALYWAGSFDAPTTADEPYTWTSNADSDRNNSALLASTDATKDFTYQDGKISCSVTSFGETQDMNFEKAEWGYAEKTADPEREIMEGSGDIGDYEVEIKGAKLAQDYEGNPAIIITYAWTNNSDDTTNAMTSMYSQAFQDGVELETAMILDSDVYDSDASMKDVRPGTTIDIQAAYVLDSETSVVEFEVSEWLTFESNPPVVSMDFDPAAL
nr:DUF5067 domain-containing protein [uncultured Dysosmobacter sp.]